jgi:hypothetical protein
MHHTNRHDVIETGEDIQDVLGVHVTEENGQKVATIKAILDPRKDFLAVKDLFLHFTNGINHRLLGPFAPVKSPNDLSSVPPVADEPAQEAETDPEATQPLVETAPSKTEKKTKTAELGTDNSTSDETIKTSSISGRGEKGI